MAALDEFLIGACLTERPLSRLPWESSDGEKTENLERDNGFTEHQPVKVVAEKAWNDWSSDTKQLEEHSSYGIKGQSNVDDGSIVSKRFGDEIMAKVILGELSTTEIVYGHGYKAKSEPKQPVDEKKIVDLGFEAAFTRGNLDTSYSLQSEIYNTPSFLRETSNSAKSTKKPSFFDSTGLSNSKSFSPTKSTAKDNARRFIELPKTSKVNMPKMPSTNEIVDVGLDQLGPSISKMKNEPNNQSGLSINSYSDAKISATFSKQTTMPWDESRWEAKHTKSTDFQNADFQKGKLNSASSCFDKATSLSAFERPQSTIGNDQAFDEYKPFKPDIKASFYNNIDFANPSTDVGYAPSFSNIGTSDTKKTGINKRSFSDSNYFGAKKTSHSISSKYTGRIPNLKSESYISSSDLRNECKKTADQRVEPGYSRPPAVDTSCFKLPTPSYSNTQYDTCKNTTYPSVQPDYSKLPVVVTSCFKLSTPSYSNTQYDTCKNTTDPSVEPGYSKLPVVFTSCFKLPTPSYSNTQYDTCENTTYPSVEPGYSKPPAVDSSCFKLSTPSYSNTQYAKKSDSNIEHKYYSNPSHTTKTTQQEVARSDIAPIKQQSSMSETMEMKDTHLTYDEYKLFRPEIKASFENNIDYVYPSTDVGYAPSFSNSDTFDTKKTAINKQSFSDSNYFETKKPSHSISSTYTGIIPYLKSDPSISSKDLRNTCKNTTYPSAEPYYSKPPVVDTSCFKLSTPSYTNSRYDTCKNTMDPSVEPCYSQPPVVDTACFRLATPSYTNTQYVKGSDRNIEQKYYSNPSHTTKATHQKVTRPDIIPTQQPSSNSETMKIEDANLSHDEYKPFEPDIKASFENNNDYANDITDVGYAPLLSDSVMSDNKIADTYIHSVTDRKPFGVNKMNQSNSLAFTNRVQIVKSESLTSDNDLKIACNIVPSLEHCYSEHPDVITTSFRLPSPSCSSTQYDKRSDQIFTTRCSSNPTHTTKTTPEVVIRPDNVSAKQPKSMSVTLDESKRASKCSNQSRSVASVQNVFTERNIGNAVGNTVSVKGSETSINQRSNPPIGSNSIKSWLVKSIESEDDSSEFETETATHNTPVAYNRLNEDILRTSDIETKQIGFKSNNKDVKSSYVNAKAEDVKPKVFKSNTIIVPPASVKTGITIVKTRADTCGIKSLDLIKKVKTVKPATVGAEEYAPLRYQSKSHDQHPISNSYSTTPNTLTVNAGHKVGLPKVSKVIVVEPEHVKRERRKKKIERMVEMIPIDIDDNMVSKQYLSDTESNTLSDDCMPVRTRMEDVRKQYISDGDDDTYDMNEDTSSWGFKEENNDHIDNNINDTYKQIMKTIKNLGCQKETKTSCPKSVKCGTKLCAAKKKVSFAKLDELPNTHSMNDLCKRCKKELSQSHSKSHSTKNKPAVKMINTDNKELEVPTQQLEGHRNAPIPSEVYYQLIDIVERNIGAEQKRSLMRSTSIAGLLERMNSYNVEHEINDMADHEDPALTEENIDSLVKKNELKTKHRTRYNSVEGMAGANETVSCLSGLSELNYNTDVSYGHGTEHDKTNRDCRKISKGRKIINFMKSLFCCKRKNKAFDVDD